MANKYENLLGTGELAVSGDAGGTFYEVPNATGASLDGAGRSENTQPYFNAQSSSSFGDPENKDFTMDVNTNPGTAAYKVMEKSFDEGSLVQCRIRTDAKRLLDNSTATRTLAVAATGVVTGANTKFTTNPVWVRNRGIVISSVLYVIEDITTEVSLSVSRPDGTNISAVTATPDWELWQFGCQWLFEAQVLNIGNVTFNSDGTAPTETVALKVNAAKVNPTFIFTTP